MHSISFQPTSDDLVAANRIHFGTSFKSAQVIRSCLIGGAGVTTMGAIFASGEGLRGQAVGATFWLLFISLIVALILGINFLLLPVRVRRIFAQQKDLHHPIVVKWDDRGISFTSEHGSSKFVWDDYMRITDSKLAIVLFQSEDLFNFIPKRALSLEETMSIMAHAGSHPT